ncbi:hypothetical protein GCM10025884_18690 [Leuconostoc gelidum subsp. gelidum]|nr:hypothetical protein GCM10025884_18690 [Leuconostoc gelidum subsp. gelidum]
MQQNHTTKWYREISKNAAEDARNHDLLNIAPTDFFSTFLMIPNSIDEQEKIGLFFKQLANTITFHQRKLNLLKEQKRVSKNNVCFINLFCATIN